MLMRFSVYYYVNGVNTYTMKGLSAEEAYSAAIPGEALLPFDGGGRWHVLMKHPALDQMSQLLTGETLRVCWQQPPDVGATGDTEHILVVREAQQINIQYNLNEQNNLINQENINNIYNNNIIE
jgi:hypothetical protein